MELETAATMEAKHGKTKNIRKRCVITILFAVCALLVFLVYMKVSPSTDLARRVYPMIARFHKKLSLRTKQHANDSIIKTTTPSYTKGHASTQSLGMNGNLSGPGGTIETATTTTTSTTATTLKHTPLFAKDEPRTLSPYEFDLAAGIQKNFMRKCSKSEVKHYVDILRKFDELFKKNGLTYFIYAGTLIGSYRNFGFIPWDDDVDVLVPDAQRAKALKALTVPGYECITAQRIRWKFDKKSDKIIKKSITWRWPFVDISFFKENKTHIWDTGFSKYVYNKNWVFPLSKRPFEGYWFNAPKNTTKCLLNNIDVTKCVTANWNHRHEYSISKKYSKKCDKLRPYYAFVNRTILPGGKVKEMLTFGSRVLQEVIFDNQLI